MKKEIKLDANGYRKFGIRDKVAYAAGDLGCNMSFSLKGTVQTFWLVFMMLETGLLSLLLLLVQIWDAVNDPMIGAIIDNDRRNYKRGEFKTYIFIGACGLLVGGAAVSLPFPGAPNVVKAILFVLGYIIWDAFYTIANVPYCSMLSLVTEDPAERAQLSTWRSIGSMVGNILPMVILPMIIWNKVTYTGNTDFLDKIYIPEESKEIFYQYLHTNPKTGEAYEIDDKFLNPLTSSQVEILIGERAFFAALIMGVIGFIAFMFMLPSALTKTQLKQARLLKSSTYSRRSSWAMMGDAIDYNEWKFGTREEGTVYSLHSFFRKLAQGVGPSVVLLLMGVLGYKSELGTILQSAETAKNMCWLVAGLYLFSAVCQFIGLALIYNLDKKTLNKMNEELAARKAVASAEEK